MSELAQAARRAERAERAVGERSIRRLWGLPGTALGVNGWPPSAGQRLFLSWNYWWQAHLLDCLVDAQMRAPDPGRLRRIDEVIRGIRIRNATGWTNRYYDDMAWLGLALRRAGQPGGRHDRVVERLVSELVTAWSEDEGGGIPWRRGDEFKNVPANGPAAILLARTGRPDRAEATVDWIDSRLRDPLTGLIWDGLRPGQVEQVVYTYCQGVVLGAELELCVRGRRPPDRIRRLIGAVATHLTNDGVLRGHAGGDSGLFTGILARYLALVAVRLPADAEDATRATAGRLVTDSAVAAWTCAVHSDGLPVFGPDWSRPAVHPRPQAPGTLPERDLSVQLSGWMLQEAAYAVIAAGSPGGEVSRADRPDR